MDRIAIFLDQYIGFVYYLFCRIRYQLISFIVRPHLCLYFTIRSFSTLITSYFAALAYEEAASIPFNSFLCFLQLVYYFFLYLLFLLEPYCCFVGQLSVNFLRYSAPLHLIHSVSHCRFSLNYNNSNFIIILYHRVQIFLLVSPVIISLNFNCSLDLD